MTSEQLTPRINANDDTVEILCWHVADIEWVEAGDDLVDLGSSKATFTVQAEYAGFVRRLAASGELSKVGKPIAQYFARKEDVPAARSPREPFIGKPSQPAFGFSRFSRNALSLLEKSALPPEAFAGSGLVTVQMIREHLDPSSRERRSPREKAASAPPANLPVPPSARQTRISKAKQAEIDSLTIGQNGFINSSLTIEFSARDLIESMEKNRFMSSSPLPIILYEFAQALASLPAFTAFCLKDQIHYYDRVDIGLALDFGKGLKVVNIAHADSLLPFQILEKVTEFSLKYARNQLSLEDLSGHTVTVTDLSGQGILRFQPLLNSFQSIILGIGGDLSLPGKPMALTLAFDHRVLAGRDVAIFLNQLKQRLLTYRSDL